MIIRGYQRGDLYRLDAQDAQVLDLPQVSEEMFVLGGAICAEEGDEVLGIGGVIPLWEDRGLAYLLLSRNAGRRLIRLFRVFELVIDAAPQKRIEAYVRAGFTEGERLAKMLGFEREACLRSFFPSGDDGVIYAKVRE